MTLKYSQKKQSAMAGRHEEVLKEAFMTKRSQNKKSLTVPNWRERWFVLSTKNLTYYCGDRQSGRQKERGRVALSRVVVVESVDRAVFQRDWVFQLCHQSDEKEQYVLYIAAVTSEERDQWLNALRRMVADNEGLAERYHKGVFLNRQWSCCGGGRNDNSCTAVTWTLYIHRYVNYPSHQLEYPLHAAANDDTTLRPWWEAKEGGFIGPAATHPFPPPRPPNITKSSRPPQPLPKPQKKKHSVVVVKEMDGGGAKEDEYGFVTAMHDFEGQTESMLSFRKGDILEVIDKGDENWWLARHPNTTRRAFIPVTFIASYSSLSSQDWYFGDIPRVQAEQLLLSDLNSYGAFLVRLHHSGEGYALSARGFLKSTQIPSVKHFRINVSPEGLFFLLDNRGFHTLNDLIDHHCIKGNSVVSYLLVEPCRRPLPSTRTVLPPPEDRFEVDRDAITLGHIIGSGSFGDVYVGTLKDVKVAIKTRRTSNASKEEFLKEAHIMKGLCHPHIVTLQAVCTRTEPFLIVTEYMSEGSLLTYLRRDDRDQLGVPQHVYIAGQVAAGMAYLEERRLMHRDLSARNVLLGPFLLCKVADFGLARICFKDSYTVNQDTKFPVRWTAPEVITHQKFTIKSDVWSFGILVYEVVTDGAIPYPGMTNREVQEHVAEGYRISQPKDCDFSLYSMMLDCWNEKSTLRPTFSHLQDFLENYEIQIASSYYEKPS